MSLVKYSTTVVVVVAVVVFALVFLVAAVSVVSGACLNVVMSDACLYVIVIATISSKPFEHAPRPVAVSPISQSARFPRAQWLASLMARGAKDLMAGGAKDAHWTRRKLHGTTRGARTLSVRIDNDNPVKVNNPGKVKKTNGAGD